MKRNGFTLIELLIVIVIISSLTGLVAMNFISGQAKARDARRKSDLTQIQRALELFYNDHGTYPSESQNRIAGCNAGGGASTAACDWGEEFRDANGTLYMDQIPDEKQPGKDYIYNVDTSGGRLRYQLFARLENDQDPILDQDGDGDADEYSVDCGDNSCNYAATSPNTDGTASF